MLSLVRVGVPRVSWAVRYLDKIQWRAVQCLLQWAESSVELLVCSCLGTELRVEWAHCKLQTVYIVQFEHCICKLYTIYNVHIANCVHSSVLAL